MGERTRILFTVMLALTVLGVVGLTGCTREKPAPTPNPDWVPPTTTAGAADATVAPTPGPEVAATTTSAEGTTGAPEPTPTLLPEVPDTPAEPTSSAGELVPTPEQPTPDTSGGAFTYVVRSGETLFSIAQRFDSSVAELVRLNDLASGDDIMAGQKLLIPGTEPAAIRPAEPEPLLHVVQAGETLRMIADRYDVTVEAIMLANNVTNANRIYVGQRLSIPGAAAPAEPETRTHVVQAGETLSQIARRYGVTMAALQTANAISDPDSIYVGQQLTIP
jgi:LysM repeat protein